MNSLGQLPSALPSMEAISTPAVPVMVVPYNGDYDQHSATLLPWLWHKLNDDGLLDLYFASRKGASFCAFVKMMSGGLNVLLATTIAPDGATPDKVIGFLTWEYLNFGGAKTAMAGFIFLKEFWDGHTSTDAGRKLITDVFTNTDVEVLVGNVAADNRLTSMFLSRLGWKKVGTLPKMQQYEGVECAANLWCITKEEFLNGKR